MNNPFAEVTPAQFDTVYGVNIRGMFFLTQFVLPPLEKSHGAVVNISSIHALQAKPEHTVYAGTKGAIVAFTRTLAIELALKGIRVNAIAPGCVPVENYAKAIGARDIDAASMGKNIPIGHVGTPADIGKAVVFLASDDGRFIVGQTLVIDGGTSSWMAFNEQFRESMSEAGVTFGKGYVAGLE
jgi:NAD(P)-dependent dehydrogenase (short-subunit alcohol dehydrogenase family)